MEIIFKRLGFSRKELKLHVLYWALFAVMINIIDPVRGTWVKQCVTLVLLLGNYMMVYYGQFYLSCNYYFMNKKLIACLITLVLITLSLGIDLITIYFVIDLPTRIGHSLPPALWGKIILNDIVVHSIVLALAVGTFQNKLTLWLLKEKSKREKMLMDRQIGFYRNLFNPHIIFNFLSFCYMYAGEKKDNSGKIIELYSDILRTSNDWKANETIRLQEEISYLQKYIQLKKLLSPSTCVQLNIMGKNNNCRILPRLILTQLENAFKHGISHEPENPIQVNLKFDKVKIESVVINKISTTKSGIIDTGRSGLGIKNFINQLEIFYNSKFKYTVKHTDSHFISSLIIYNS